MTLSPLTYARNGALASLGLYTIVVTIFLVLSGSFSQARPVLPLVGWEERLEQAVPTLLLSDPHPLSHPARRS